MTLADLAARADFDPDDYRRAETATAKQTRCCVNGCRVRQVPVSALDGARVGVCGYCRAAVKSRRAQTPDAATA